MTDYYSSLSSIFQMKSPGKYFVLLLIGFSLLAAAGTFWNYSSHVFSTNKAFVLDCSGRIEATFPLSVTSQLHPHQQGKVTLKNITAHTDENGKFFPAEVVTVVKGAVLLQLLENPKLLTPGEACEVTIDTTIPTDALP